MLVHLACSTLSRRLAALRGDPDRPPAAPNGEHAGPPAAWVFPQHLSNHVLFHARRCLGYVYPGPLLADRQAGRAVPDTRDIRLNLRANWVSEGPELFLGDRLVATLPARPGSALPAHRRGTPDRPASAGSPPRPLHHPVPAATAGNATAPQRAWPLTARDPPPPCSQPHQRKPCRSSNRSRPPRAVTGMHCPKARPATPAHATACRTTPSRPTS